MKKIFLSTVMMLTVVCAEFTTVDQPSGVVKDTNTLLQWQDDYSDNASNIKIATWTAAIDYCEALGLAGAGWRLPNKKELLSLVDYAVYNPSISSTFNNTISGYYWSSTTYANYTSYAWIVGFYRGYTDDGSNKTYTRYVRCVR